MEKYSLTLTSKQLSVIIDATELLARLLRKQSFGITDRLDFKDLSAENKLQELLNQAETYPELNETHQIAWDIYQTARHRLAWDTTPEGGITVNFDKPLHTSKEPLPTIVKQPKGNKDGKYCIKSEKHLNGQRSLNVIKRKEQTTSEEVINNANINNANTEDSCIYLNGWQNLNVIKQKEQAALEIMMTYPNGEASSIFVVLSEQEREKLKSIL